MQKTIKLYLVLSGVLIMSNSLFAQVSFPTYSKGLVLKSDDGSAKMKFNFRVQSLFTASINESTGETNYTMLVRRSRLKSNGYFMNEKFGYKFEMGLSNRDVGNGKEVEETNSAPRLLLDAVLKYNASEHLQIWFGQTKLPGNRERVISSQALQFVDRSLVNSDFNIDRDFGVWLVYSNSLGKMPVILKGAMTNGEGRNITVSNIGGFSYTGRVEILPLGEFSNKKGHYFSSDLDREQKPKLAIGCSYNYNERAARQNGQLGSFVNDSNGYYGADLKNLAIDLIFKYKGWSAIGEYGARSTDHIFTDADQMDRFYDLGDGINFQAGYLFKNNYELAGRYTAINSKGDFSAITSRKQYTFGVSKYFSRHFLKWQSDISYTKANSSSTGSFMYRFQFEFGI